MSFVRARTRLYFSTTEVSRLVRHDMRTAAAERGAAFAGYAVILLLTHSAPRLRMTGWRRLTEQLCADAVPLSSGWQERPRNSGCQRHLHDSTPSRMTPCRFAAAFRPERCRTIDRSSTYSNNASRGAPRHSRRHRRGTQRSNVETTAHRER